MGRGEEQGGVGTRGERGGRGGTLDQLKNALAGQHPDSIIYKKLMFLVLSATIGARFGGHSVLSTVVGSKPGSLVGTEPRVVKIIGTRSLGLGLQIAKRAAALPRGSSSSTCPTEWKTYTMEPIIATTTGPVSASDENPATQAVRASAVMPVPRDGTPPITPQSPKRPRPHSPSNYAL